ncbi:MAG: hypothetical protein Q9198_005318 [Flavoplaca austrocitrina]
MRPLDANEINQDLLIRGPTLLLDTTKFAIRFIIQLVLANEFPLQLPAELWLNIINQYCESTLPNYVAVQPTSISTSPMGQLLRSRTVKSNERGLNDKNDPIRSAEFFLNNLHRTNKDCKKHCLFPTEDTDSTYAIEFPNISPYGTSTTAGLRMPDCLFTAITFDGVTAWLDFGRCWVCRGTRDICPGCTKGVGKDIDVWIGHGIDLACPLCMGLDCIQKDKAFLKMYYDENPPAEEKEARDDRVARQMGTLGYF